MKKYLSKFLELEQEIYAKKGPFSLFALFFRENGIGEWDLAVSAPWIDEDQTAALKYISHRVQKEIPRGALLKLSHVALIDQSNPALDEFLDEFHVEHGTVEFRNREFFGKQMKYGYVITAQKVGVEAEVVGA